MASRIACSSPGHSRNSALISFVSPSIVAVVSQIGGRCRPASTFVRRIDTALIAILSSGTISSRGSCLALKVPIRLLKYRDVKGDRPSAVPPMNRSIGQISQGSFGMGVPVRNHA